MTGPLVLATGEVDFLAQSIARIDGRNLRLSALEAKLLDYLVKRPGASVGRDELMDAVWAYNAASSSRTLAVTVFRLRTKIEEDPAHPKHIITVYGHGYRFVPHTGPVGVVAEPTSGPRFVGRRGELHRLKTLCKYGPLIATVTGPPGVGKSRITRELGRALAIEGFAIVTCDLVNANTLETLARAVARGFGLSLRGQDAPAVSAAVASAVRDYPGRTMIILDEADRVLGPIAALSPTWVAAGAAVVCTSRERISCRGEEVVDLGPLSTEDAAILYREVTGQPLNLHVEELVAHLDGLPLAIEIAAGHDGKLTAADIEALGSALEASWVLLSAEEQRALSRFTHFRDGFDLSAAEAILGPEEDWLALDILDRLDRCSLLNVDRKRRFSLLESVRAFAASKADPVAVEHSRQRLAEHFLALAGPILSTSNRYRTSEVDLRDNIANLIEISTWTDRPADAAQAILAMRHAMLTICADRELCQRATVALETLDLDDSLRARLLSMRGVVAYGWRTDEDSRTDVNRAIALLEPKNQAHHTAEAHIEAAHIDARDHKPVGADEHLQRAQALLQNVGHTRLHWRLLMARTETLALSGDRQGALEAVQDAQNRAESDLNGGELAWSFWREGQTRLRFGEPNEGVAANRRALALARTVGDVRLERVASGSLAIGLQHCGDIEEAMEVHQQSLELHRIAGCVEDVAIGLGNMGNVYQELGEMGLAMEHYDRALKLNAELGDDVRSGVVYGSRAMGFHRMGQLAQADEGYRACVDILRPANRVLQLSFILCFQALLALEFGRDDEADALLEEVTDNLARFSNQDIEATLQLVKARVAGDLGEAIVRAKQIQSPIVRLAVTLVSAGGVDP